MAGGVYCRDDAGVSPGPMTDLKGYAAVHRAFLAD